MQRLPQDFNRVSEETFKPGWWKVEIPEFEPKDEFERRARYLADFESEMAGLKRMNRECFQGHMEIGDTNDEILD